MNCEKCKKLCMLMESRLNEFLLLLRLTVGVVFVQAGWGKFMNFDRTVAFFSKIGIPLSEFNVVLAAGTELVGGALLIIGLGTRLITLPMAFVMIVAILTAHLGDIGGIVDLLSLKAWIYLVLFLLLSATGAGKWSLDAMCCKDDG